ncbi:hypothetical protein JW906_15555 [bacterium]|nr:hypothetical protein [bacterium]
MGHTQGEKRFRHRKEIIIRKDACSNLLALKSIGLVMLISVPSIFSRITLEGVVTDNGAEWFEYDAEPVVNALVEATDQANLGRHFSDYTDSEGKCVIQITETGVEAHSAHPELFRLSQNYPNPFNPSTVISFDLPHSVKIRIDVHNVLGQRVKTLFNGYHSERSGRVVWDADE